MEPYDKNNSHTKKPVNCLVFITESQTLDKGKIQYIVFFLDGYPNWLYIRHKMEQGRQNSAKIDPIRRTLLQRAGSLFLALAGTTALPSVCQAACKLVFPMPHRPKPPSQSNNQTPRVAIVIDDIGNSLHMGRQFLALSIPITFSILPFRPFSAQLMDEIAVSGHDILLHQPMEPFRQDIDPGPGAVFTSFSASRIQDTIRANLLEIGAARGVNNHMGSRFTSNKEKMQEALEAIRHDGLFFIDSVTSPRSVAYKIAKQLHISAGHRNVFLDCPATVHSTFCQMNRLVLVAKRYGKAIGIGHPFTSTLEGIKRFLAVCKNSEIEIEFKGVSNLIWDHGDPNMKRL